MAGLLPGLWLAVEWVSDGLGARPYTVAIRETGLWSIRFLLLALAITPIQYVSGWKGLHPMRRAVGLTALGYALVHVAAYAADWEFDLATVASAIVLRLYLFVGAVATFGMVLLGSVWNDWSVRRLGQSRWQRWHRATYGVAALALLHFLLRARGGEVMLLTGAFLWLLGYRLARKPRPGPLFLASLGVAAALLTAAAEAGGVAFTSVSRALAVLAFNFRFDVGLRPSWWVLLAGLAVAALVAIRARTRGLPPLADAWRVGRTRCGEGAVAVFPWRAMLAPDDPIRSVVTPGSRPIRGFLSAVRRRHRAVAGVRCDAPALDGQPAPYWRSPVGARRLTAPVAGRPAERP